MEETLCRIRKYVLCWVGVCGYYDVEADVSMRRGGLGR